MAKRGAKDEMATQVISIINGIRAMARPDPASLKSDPAYLIDIQITKDGKIMANGKDVLQ
jgi:hypothetical protein